MKSVTELFGYLCRLGVDIVESGMKNNRIEANYVHHFARRLYDAGGLYTLSNNRAP